MIEIALAALAGGVAVWILYPVVKRLLAINANDGDNRLPKIGRPRSIIKRGSSARKAAVLTDVRPTVYSGRGRPRKTDIDFR